MRTLFEHETRTVSGGNSYRPALSEIVKAAAPVALDAAVGGAAGLITRNVLGISHYGAQEVVSYAITGGITAFGSYVTAAICKDPGVLTR